MQICPLSHSSWGTGPVQTPGHHLALGLVFLVPTHCSFKALPSPKLEIQYNTHYSLIPYLQSHLLPKLSLQPQYQHSWAFPVIHPRAQSCKNFQAPDTHLPSQGCTRLPLRSCRSSHIVNKCSFCGLFNVIFLHSYAFCWQFHCLKWHGAEAWSSISEGKKVVL